jgi:hypothetical protein
LRFAQCWRCWCWTCMRSITASIFRAEESYFWGTFYCLLQNQNFSPCQSDKNVDILEDLTATTFWMHTEVCNKSLQNIINFSISVVHTQNTIQSFNLWLKCCVWHRCTRVWRGSSIYPGSVWSQEQIHHKRDLLPYDVCHWYQQHPVCVW